MKVIVGLGNPGSEYEDTRHNVGFCILDRLCTIFGGNFQNDKNFRAFANKITINDQTVLLLKPNTYMNRSGLAVAAALRWFKIKPSDLLVIHDDTSLPLGRLRFQKAGSAGGQHGVESIIESLGGVENFNRLKVGIGPDPGGDLRANYVLSKFPQGDQSKLEQIFFLSTEAVKVWLAEDIEMVMNKFNGLDLSS